MSGDFFAASIMNMLLRETFEKLVKNVAENLGDICLYDDACNLHEFTWNNAVTLIVKYFYLDRR